MRLTLFLCGICVATFAIILDLERVASQAGVGYFILASAMLLASAIWKPAGTGDDRFRSMQQVYSALAAEPMDMDSLTKRLTGEGDDGALADYYRAVIGRMLARRQLVISGGLVTIGVGTDDAA